MFFRKKIFLLVAALVSVLAGSASADRVHGYGDSRQRHYQTFNRGYYPNQVVRRNTYVNPYYNSGYYNNANRYPVYNNRTYDPNNSYRNGYYNNGYYNDRPGIRLGPVRLNF